MVLAQTIYGEARGEDEYSWKAIGQVIKNRVDGGRVKADRQFSCWNEGDPNLEVIEKAPGSGLDKWEQILAIAK